MKRSSLWKILLAQAVMAGTVEKYASHHSYSPKPIKVLPKQLHRFIIKGIEVEAYSKKDAIKRLN